MKGSLLVAASLLAALSSSSCSDSSGLRLGTVPAKLTFLTSVKPTGYRVAETIATPITVRVTDGAGLPVPQVQVQFLVGVGGGFTDGPGNPVTSDDRGIATTHWTLSARAGVDSLIARVFDDPSVPAITIKTTTSPDIATQVIMRPVATTLDQGSRLSLDVHPADRYGNLLNDIPAGGSIVLTSSDQAVATVSGTSLTATGPGLATITASYQPPVLVTPFIATSVVSVPTPSGPGGPAIPAFSAAVTVVGDDGITIVRSDGTIETRIACGAQCEFLTHPVWSRDGSKLSLTGKRGDLSVLFVVNRDGTDLHQIISTPKLHIIQSKGPGDELWPLFDEDWSSDNKLVYLRRTIGGASIETVLPDGSDQRTIMMLSGSVATFGDVLRYSQPHWGFGNSMISVSMPQLSLMNADGTNLRTIAVNGGGHSWSRDGTTIAAPGQLGLSVVDPISGSVRSLGIPSGWTFCWSPDGQQLSVVTDTLGNVTDNFGSWWSISTIRTDGTNLRKVLPVAIDNIYPLPHAWTPDGRFLIYPDDRSTAGGDSHLYAQSVAEGTNAKLGDLANADYIAIAGTPACAPASPFLRLVPGMSQHQAGNLRGIARGERAFAR